MRDEGSVRMGLRIGEQQNALPGDRVAEDLSPPGPGEFLTWMSLWRLRRIRCHRTGVLLLGHRLLLLLESCRAVSRAGQTDLPRDRSRPRGTSACIHAG